MLNRLAFIWQQLRIEFADSVVARAMDVYSRKNEPELARALLIECVEKGQDSPDVFICLSACEAQLNPQSTEADKWISRAREKGAPQHSLVHAKYFLAWTRGNYEEAAILAKELVTSDSSPEMLEVLCFTLGKTEPAESERLAHTLVERFPDHPAGYFGLAAAAESREDDAAYLQNMRAAEHLAPERPDIQFSLGQALCSNEKYEDAASSYVKALQLGYEPISDAYVGLAICLLRGSKEIPEARKYCRLALEATPGHEEATQLLAECNQMRGQEQ